MKLLAVDDDRGTLAIFRHSLAGLSLQIFTATTSESALDVVKAEHLQIVLLDLVLPRSSASTFLTAFWPSILPPILS